MQQVQALDKQNDRLKVVVADSLYGNQYFLAVFLLVTTVVALVRLRRNLRLYENPIPKPPQSKGRPRVHGAAFKLTDPSRPADRSAIFTLAGQKIRLAAWHNLHLRKLPALVGMVLRLVADPSPPARGPAWRRTPLTKGQMLTPGMVQRGALPFLLTLGTPAAAPRPAGKGHGRPKGYHPQPKKRHPVVRKGQKQPKQTKKQHQMAV